MTRYRKSVVEKMTTSALKLKEADVLGATVQAAIRAGEGSSQVHDFLLLDVIPLSVRLERCHDETLRTQHQHSHENEQTFETHADKQPAFLTRVFRESVQ